LARTAGAAYRRDFTFANVRKVACAIARYVVRAEKPNAGVLVGYDTRYASERFARAAAEVVFHDRVRCGSPRSCARRPRFRCCGAARGAGGS